ncbi:MAG: hypothetical protein ABR567_13360 [Myxococcales bacterium]|nr:hypothetical protein [Myxococcales bacterium]
MWTCPCKVENEDAALVCSCGRGQLMPAQHGANWTPMHQSFDEFRSEDLLKRILPALKFLEHDRPKLNLRVARALVYARAMLGWAALKKVPVNGLVVRWATAFYLTGKLKPLPRTTYVGQSGEAKSLAPPWRQYSALFARAYISALPEGKHLAAEVSEVLFVLGRKGTPKTDYTVEQKIVHDAYRLDRLRNPDPEKTLKAKDLLFLSGHDRDQLIAEARVVVGNSETQDCKGDDPIAWVASLAPDVEPFWLRKMLQEENEVSFGRRLAANKISDPLEVPDADMDKWFKDHFTSKKKTWMDVRATYISKLDAEAPRRMLKLQGYRARIVDGLLDKLINEQAKETGFQHLKFTSTGSTNLTSDYDVQLYDNGALKGFAGGVIKKFNETFRSRYGLESGTALDTNVYDPGFLPREDSTENEEVRASEKRIAGANAVVQDQGALAKICKFMRSDQWKYFQLAMLDQIFDVKKKQSARRQLDAATKMIDRYHAEIAKKFTDKGHKEDDELRAKNEVYAEKLAAVNAARVQQGKINQEIVELKRKKGTDAELASKRAALDEMTTIVHATFVEASVWAHEAYHTEGPLMDVVYNQQEAFKKVFEYPSPTWDFKADQPRWRWGDREARGKAELSKMEMLESLNEQFGDALKDIEHYSHQGPENPDPFAKTAVQTSKYVKRLFAIADMLKQPLEEKEKKLSAINGRANTGLLALRASSSPPSRDLLAELGREASLREPADYVKLLTALAARINAKVRSSL